MTAPAASQAAQHLPNELATAPPVQDQAMPATPPAVATAPPVVDEPDVFDLDTAEAPADIKGIFAFRVEAGGPVFHARHPQTINWQDLNGVLTNNVLFFRYVLPDDEYKQFMNSNIPTWKINAFMKAYYAHFGLPGLEELVRSLG